MRQLHAGATVIGGRRAPGAARGDARRRTLFLHRQLAGRRLFDIAVALKCPALMLETASARRGGHLTPFYPLLHSRAN